jgi:hypothetical protein
MLSIFGISITFGKSEVNQVDHVLLLVNPNQEVIRLHISVDEVVVVEILKSLNHLVCNHENALQRELPLTESKKVFQ